METSQQRHSELPDDTKVTGTQQSWPAELKIKGVYLLRLRYFGTGLNWDAVGVYTRNYI